MDWEFENVSTDKYSATIHPYHARFIPQIPERFINQYTTPGDTVLDPFNGSGTTTMVASTMGREGIGVDLNPLACLIARVKCGDYEVARLEHHVDWFLQETRQATEEVSDVNSIEDIYQTDLEVSIPDFPNQEGWFMPQVLAEMGAIREKILRIEEEELKEFYLVALSATTKPLSKTQEDWTYIGDNMVPDSDSNSLEPDNEVKDVYSTFRNKVYNVLKGVKSYSKEQPAKVTIHQKDAKSMEVIEDEEVDFCITSPPYVNAVDYARYHRLSFYWLEYPITDTKEDEVGARAKRGRASAIEQYFEESSSIYEEVFRTLKDGGEFILVIGNSQHKHEEIPTVSRVKAICQDIGYDIEGEIRRDLHRQSMSQKNITEESIILLSK